MSPRELLEEVRRNAPPGLDVVGRVSGSARRLPTEVALALAGASAEAVRNVERHSGARVAHVRVRASRSRVRVAVVDRGSGRHESSPGFGLSSSITSRMDEVGGVARVRASPGRGTVVDLEWSRRRRLSPIAVVHDQTRRALHEQPVVRQAGIALLVSNLYLAARQVPGSPHVLVLASIAAVLSVIMIIAILWVPSHPPTWGGVIALAWLQTALALAQVVLAGPGSLADFRSWGVGFATLPMVLLALHSPVRMLPLLLAPSVVPVALIVSFEAGTDLSSALGAILTCQLIVLAYVLGAVTRFGLRRELEQRNRLLSTADREVREQRIADARREHLQHTLSTTVPWLDRMAAGKVDPSDPRVRAKARSLSLEARDDLYLPGFFDRELRAVVREARTRGCRVEIREGFAPGAHSRTSGVLLREVAARLSAGCRLVLTPPSNARATARLVVVPPLDDDSSRSLSQAAPTVRVISDRVSTTVEFSELSV